MMLQKTWDKYEVALLIDCYENIKNGEDQKSALMRLSKDLRNMAIFAGKNIDETYRNYNGMVWQYAYIKQAFNKGSYGTRRPTPLFVKMVELYDSDRCEFDKILEEAYRISRREKEIKMQSFVDTKQFMDWLHTINTKKYTPERCVECVTMASQYATSHGVTRESFWNFTDYREFNKIRVRLSSNRIFKLTAPKLFHDFEVIGKFYSDYIRENCQRSERAKNDEVSEIRETTVQQAESEPQNTYVQDVVSGSDIANDDVSNNDNKEEVVHNRKRGRKTKEKIVCPQQLKDLLLEKFSYGLRVDSFIDMSRLRGYAEEIGISITENEEELKAQIIDAGILSESKVYFFTHKLYEDLVQMAEEIFGVGYQVIYYEKLFEKNSDWLIERNILSEVLLKDIFVKESQGFFVGRNFLVNSTERINEFDAVESELKRVWGDNAIHSYQELYELLPYIPEEKIRQILSRSNQFVWSSLEHFAWIDRVFISDNEKQTIVDYVNEKCDSVGFATISEVPLGQIEEENYELSINAIYDAVYNIVLKDGFILKGRILTKDQSNTDIWELARSYCLGKDEFLFTDLYNYVQSVNGTAYRPVAYKAAYDQMVRVAENRFVADKHVLFDVKKIDELLSTFVKGAFIAVKGVASFALFPDCNYAWNHYILESFCYRFSEKFRLELQNFNEKNVGLIVRKDSELSYVDILAKTVTGAGIELTIEQVGDYLYNNGYTTKSRMSLLSEVIERARRILEDK